MPVYKDGSRGTWYCKFRYTDWQGNRKETTKRGFATKREAKEYEENYIRQARNQSDMTLDSLYAIYYKDREKNVKLSTLRNIRNAVKVHILPVLGKLPINEITPNVIRKWQNEMKTKQLSDSSLKAINCRLSSLLNFAVKYYGLSKNPMSITGVQGHYVKRIDYWSKDEFDTFYASVTNPIDKTAFMTLYYTGMRVGELLALTKNDIDLDNMRITINKTLSQLRVVTTPKTKSSVRVISIPHKLGNMLREYMNHMPSIDSMFPIRYGTLLAHYRKAIELSGVRPLKVHSLRHAHASNLLAQNVPIAAVAKRLGHSSAKITLSVYAHAEKNSEEKIADLLENL